MRKRRHYAPGQPGFFGAWTPWLDLPDVRFWIHGPYGSLQDVSGRGCTIGGATQPTVSVDSSYGNQLVFDFTSSNVFTLSLATNVARPYTVLVIGHTALTNFRVLMDGADGTNTHQVAKFNNANAYLNEGAVLQSSTSFASPRALAGVFNGASSSILVSSRGAGLVSGNAGTFVIPSSWKVGTSSGDVGLTQAWGGKVASMGICGVAISADDKRQFMNWAAALFGISVAA